MMTTDPSARGHLTRAGIARAALELAHADGLDALTVRRLAARLDVTAMALYWHFRNKDALLDGMAERLFDGIDHRVPAEPWPEQLRALWGSVLAVLRTHPRTAVLAATRTVTSQNGLCVTEAMLEVLHRAGFSPAEATQIARYGLRTLVHLAAGPTAGGGPAQRGTPATEGDGVSGLSAQRYPRLAEAAGPLATPPDPEEQVRFGFELLLAGIEATAARARDTSESASTPGA